ncbi:MAG: hypothetical protein WCL13_02425, partial [bacterium]
ILSLVLDIRTIGKVIYFKISDMLNLRFFDVSILKNQWVKLNVEALKNQLGLEKFDAQIKEVQNNQDLSSEQKEKIKTAFQQAKIFKITEKLSGEKIEGVSTYHYKFIIDRAGVKIFYIEVNRIIRGREITQKELIDFDKNLEEVESPAGEIFVGKKDMLPYKIVLSYIIKNSPKSKSPVKVNLNLLLKNFNKPIEVEIPAQVKTTEEIISSILGGQAEVAPSIATSSLSQSDSKMDTDQDGLDDQTEVIYGTDLDNPDTDGDGFKDGEEVTNGYNPNGPGKLLE